MCLEWQGTLLTIHPQSTRGPRLDLIPSINNTNRKRFKIWGHSPSSFPSFPVAGFIQDKSILLTLPSHNFTSDRTQSNWFNRSGLTWKEPYTWSEEVWCIIRTLPQPEVCHGCSPHLGAETAEEREGSLLHHDMQPTYSAGKMGQFCSLAADWILFLNLASQSPEKVGLRK